MFKHRKGVGKLLTHSRGRRAVMASASLVGAGLAALSMSGPAMAETINTGAPSANSVILGSGSATDYNMMQGIDLVFNQTPGCVITSGSVPGAPAKGNQQLDFSCETNSSGTTLEQVAGSASYLDNPVNDVAVEEPPMGSSNGIAQLEEDQDNSAYGIGASNSTENVSTINFARSSRDPSAAKDLKGLNFVGYAKDGVAPFYWKKVGGATNSIAKIAANLTGADLLGIWDGSIYDWGQLGAKTSEPIYVYSAQEGSGTQATFETYLDSQSGAPSGFDPSSTANDVNCKDPIAPGTKVVTGGKTPTVFPAGPLTTDCQGPQVIFENEDASELANLSSTTASPVATTWEGDQSTALPLTAAISDSIFFYSPGKFQDQCAGLKEQASYVDHSKMVIADSKAGADCGSTPPPSGYSPTLAEVNGIEANPQTIMDASGTQFPIVRTLYNVYSNGSDSLFPEATAATLNYVSEVGFICKPQTIDGTVETSLPATTYTVDSNAGDIIDPATGLWYHDEIYNVIVANGFIPVDAKITSPLYGDLDAEDGPAQPENAAGATNTAYSLLTADNGPSGTEYGETYLSPNVPGASSGGNTSIPTGSNPDGFCILSTTDGNANGN